MSRLLSSPCLGVLPFLLGWAPACSSTGKDADTRGELPTDTGEETSQEDSDPGKDTDTDTDPGNHTENYVAEAFFYNHLAPAGPVATGLDYVRVASFPDPESLCSIIGTATEGSAHLAPCAACDFAYDLVVSGSVATGPACGHPDMIDGRMDGYEAGWGFAENYDYYYPGYGYFPFTDTVLYYFPPTYGSGWYAVTFAYGGNPYGGYTLPSGDGVEAWTGLDYGYVYMYP